MDFLFLISLVFLKSNYWKVGRDLYWTWVQTHLIYKLKPLRISSLGVHIACSREKNYPRSWKIEKKIVMKLWQRSWSRCGNCGTSSWRAEVDLPSWMSSESGNLSCLSHNTEVRTKNGCHNSTRFWCKHWTTVMNLTNRVCAAVVNYS